MRIFKDMCRETFSEVPGEYSFTIAFADCPHACKGCFWKDTDEEVEDLDVESLILGLPKNISCVCFMGLDWDEKALHKCLDICEAMGKKTALYAGVWKISQDLLNKLDYVKLAPYEEGVPQPKIREVKSGKIVESPVKI